MELRYYHNGSGFIKSICRDEKDLNDNLNVGDKLIRSGLEKGHSLEEQIEDYELLIANIQTMKKYKVSVEDQKLYCASILALYKLNKIDPDDPDSPFWISPKRKKFKNLK